MVDLWKVTSNHWAMGIAGYALEVGAGAVNGGSSHLPAERSQDGFFRSENRSGFWPGEKNILIIPMGNMWESSEAACAAGILGMAPTGYLVVGVPAMAAKLRDVSYFWLNNPSYLATFRLLNQGPFFLWRLDETCWWRRIGCWGHKKDISGTPYHCRKNLLFPTNFLQIFLTNPVMVRPGDQLRPGRIHRRHCAPAVGCWANSGERPPRLALAGWESEGAHRHGGPLALFFAHVFHENLRNCEYLSKNLWMCNCSYTPPHTHVYIYNIYTHIYNVFMISPFPFHFFRMIPSCKISNGYVKWCSSLPETNGCRIWAVPSTATAWSSRWRNWEIWRGAPTICGVSIPPMNLRWLLG